MPHYSATPNEMIAFDKGDREVEIPRSIQFRRFANDAVFRVHKLFLCCRGKLQHPPRLTDLNSGRLLPVLCQDRLIKLNDFIRHDRPREFFGVLCGLLPHFLRQLTI